MSLQETVVCEDSVHWRVILKTAFPTNREVSSLRRLAGGSGACSEDSFAEVARFMRLSTNLAGIKSMDESERLNPKL